MKFRGEDGKSGQGSVLMQFGVNEPSGDEVSTVCGSGWVAWVG